MRRSGRARRWGGAAGTNPDPERVAQAAPGCPARVTGVTPCHPPVTPWTVAEKRRLCAKRRQVTVSRRDRVVRAVGRVRKRGGSIRRHRPMRAGEILHCKRASMRPAVAAFAGMTLPSLQQAPLRSLLVARPGFDPRRLLHRADQRGELGGGAVDQFGDGHHLHRREAAELGFDQRVAARLSQDFFEPISRGHAVDERSLIR